MRMHYDNYMRACVSAGIGYSNPKYDASTLDAEGLPTEPEMLYTDGTAWRLISFDETRVDDKTHGDGGDRKGRSERCLYVGSEDDGECVGNKHGGTSASLVGGSNGAYEGLPPYAASASATFDPAWIMDGPTTTINGHTYGMEATCNDTGAIKGAAPVDFLKRSVLKVWEARGMDGPTEAEPGVLVCDGAGGHLTVEFIDWCIDHHFILVLRTPNCSQKQQNEVSTPTPSHPHPAPTYTEVHRVMLLLWVQRMHVRCVWDVREMHMGAPVCGRTLSTSFS